VRDFNFIESGSEKEEEDEDISAAIAGAFGSNRGKDPSMSSIKQDGDYGSVERTETALFAYSGKT
jgi:hypothetical protein